MTAPILSQVKLNTLVQLINSYRENTDKINLLNDLLAITYLYRIKADTSRVNTLLNIENTNDKTPILRLDENPTPLKKQKVTFSDPPVISGNIPQSILKENK
jgi:hypothetical protein